MTLQLKVKCRPNKDNYEQNILLLLQPCPRHGHWGTGSGARAVDQWGTGSGALGHEQWISGARAVDQWGTGSRSVGHGQWGTGA